MTKEQIIRMAREAGEAEGMAEFVFHPVIERFAKLVAQHEREACAKVCESIDMESFGVLPVRTLMITNHCAEAIRARGQA